MKHWVPFLCITIFLISKDATCQNNLPIIHSTIDSVDIRDGKEFNKGEWFLTPEYKPDIYTSNKIGELVTFYTDIDTISFTVHQDSVFDFIIVKGKDSAYTQIKYEPSYLDILRGAKEYNFNEENNIPRFTYQDSSNINLKELRIGFNLDSIAGKGNELSGILNLMHWIHDLIPHDGNHENPAIKNAMSMIRTCNKEERGLNSRGLATVLNECYLSIGIKSRFVTCMPKDSVFNDCHVINMVFSNDLNEWIWIDPTHDGYIINENGDMLGVEETRRQLIEGGILVLNPDANWNHKSSTVREYYLFEYMAKNLYRFECPLRSEYNFETKKRGKTVEYVELIPLDGYNQQPKYNKRKSKKSGVTYITYKTNNPNEFWLKPETKDVLR